jgi:hypothetical protein
MIVITSVDLHTCSYLQKVTQGFQNSNDGVKATNIFHDFSQLSGHLGQGLHKRLDYVRLGVSLSQKIRLQNIKQAL